jgi:hypothetical protein
MCLDLAVTLRARGVDAAQPERPWLEVVGRVGIAAKGVVYFAVGAIAARTGIEHRGRLDDPQRALVEIGAQPMGRWLLLAVAVGLCAYVVWRLAEAVLGPWRRGRPGRGLLRRAVSFGVALAYTGLATSALRLALIGERPASAVAQSRALSAEVLELPGGPWLLGAVGAGIAVFGLVEVLRGVLGSFTKMLRPGSTWASRIGRFGLPARGFVFVVVGAFVIRAAWSADPHEVHGLAGALRAVARASGGWALAVAGVGLAAYGVFTMLEARDRDFRAAS